MFTCPFFYISSYNCLFIYIFREVNHVSTSLTELEKLYTTENADKTAIIQQLDKVQEILKQLQVFICRDR